MATQTLQLISIVSGKRVDKSNDFTGTLYLSLEETVADSVTDQLVVAAVDVSAIQAFYMVSDQAITVEINNSTTGTPTINLTANDPLIWWTGAYYTNLLDTDITAIYLTNSSGSTATFNFEVITDATP